MGGVRGRGWVRLSGMRQVDQRTSVSGLIGTVVLDGAGRMLGKVVEFAVAPTVDACRVEALAVRGGGGLRLFKVGSLRLCEDGRLQVVDGAQGAETEENSGAYLMLERDLLDQQIIDVHGHKVVRVADVDLVWVGGAEGCSLRIAEVEVGMRGAVRRLLKGLPRDVVEGLACRVKPRVIPWEFVDLIDRDPARRVRLKIEQDRLSKMHPSDLADILEELAPAEGQALFSSLDEEVAAEALEEVELKTQRKLIEGMDSETVAGIIEEMDPGAAADLLSELGEERSDAILEEMGERERHDVEELLEYEADSAAGLMTTEFVAVQETATVLEARAVLERFEGDRDALTDVFLLGEGERVVGSVPVVRMLFAAGEKAMGELAEGHMVSSDLLKNDRKVAELFDKYNLRCLPVVDAEKRLVGVIRAEQVIGWLRGRS